MKADKRHYQKRKAQGESRRAYWAHPDDHKTLKELADMLREKRERVER